MNYKAGEADIAAAQDALELARGECIAADQAYQRMGLAIASAKMFHEAGLPVEGDSLPTLDEFIAQAERLLRARGALQRAKDDTFHAVMANKVTASARPNAPQPKARRPWWKFWDGWEF